MDGDDEIVALPFVGKCTLLRVIERRILKYSPGACLKFPTFSAAQVRHSAKILCYNYYWMVLCFIRALPAAHGLISMQTVYHIIKFFVEFRVFHMLLIKIC